MKFKSLFLAHVPDAEPEEHQAELETELYKLFVRLVKNQQEALDVINNVVDQEGIQSIALCPGFSHEEVAEISHTAGPDVGVTVARGDGKSSMIAKETMERAGWFEE